MKYIYYGALAFHEADRCHAIMNENIATNGKDVPCGSRSAKRVYTTIKCYAIGTTSSNDQSTEKIHEFEVKIFKNIMSEQNETI